MLYPLLCIVVGAGHARYKHPRLHKRPLQHLRVLSIHTSFLALKHVSLAGVKDPIFSSSVAAVSQKPLRAVLLEIAQAYARNLAPKEEKMTAESLKVQLGWCEVLASHSLLMSLLTGNCRTQDVRFGGR